MKVAIVEDIDEIRNGYYAYLSCQPEFEKVYPFQSAEAFIEHLNEHTIDVVLMDIGLPGMSGIECMQHVKKQQLSAEIIMLTVYDDGTRIFNSLCAGATGYLLKTAPLQEIKEAILQIKQGMSPMDPSIARRVVEYFNPKQKISEQLTEKELEVVRAISDGLSYKLIANRLSISINTVRHHIRAIYKKLQVNSKAEVIALYTKGKI